MLHDVIEVALGIIQSMNQTITNLSEVMGWKVGRHSNRNTLASIADEVREFAREDFRFV